MTASSAFDVHIIAIAGGSGSGKSTLCESLLERHSSEVGLVQLDDYLKPKEDVPVVEGFPCWDHPDALDFQRLLRDLKRLKGGEAVTIRTKNARLNPEFANTHVRIPVIITPRPIILLEGFLSLFDERIRVLLDDSFFLDLPHEVRYERRAHFKIPEYERKILVPMHERYVEPTKTYARHVIDVQIVDATSLIGMVEKTLGLH
ncbi:MAG: hypothetical protein KGI41_02485 [Patescibacteria group bacterium]|nr:hypothetical protein [Patescibacteria group bacterium]MDE1966082.1 hypothetical protein [Patescibacteria group bacterium]